MKIDENNTLRNYSVEQKIFLHRIITAFCFILIFFSILIMNMYDLQILHFTDYITKSNKNRIKVLPISPNRGIIFDRHGIPLAFNRTIYRAQLVPGKKDFPFKKTLQNLRSILNLTDDDIQMFEKQRKRWGMYSPIILKKNLNEKEIACFAVNQYRFPNVELKGYKKRFYPYGEDLTHVLGFVSNISSPSVFYNQRERGIYNHYLDSSDIGQVGIENYYESLLHGRNGYEEVEVNNRGRAVRLLNVIEAKKGKDIYLNIDLELQQYIQNFLKNTRSAVVVTNPSTGEVLALVSTPSYDPNLFVDKISKKDYQKLLNDKEHPFYNRTIQAAYPPASTIKPYVAISALSSGSLDLKTILFDPGWWKLPGSTKYYHDWKKSGHGYLNITKSIEESSDTFFYHVAYSMGIDSLSKWMKKFGYGHRTGIDLPNENTGNMPTREWKMNRFKTPWYQGDTIAVGIGQGYWTATPIQMNNAMMILINDGQVKIPYLLHGVRKGNNVVSYNPPISNIPIDNIPIKYWKIIKNAMYGVANHRNGTARSSFANAPYKIAAKSGTAQVFGLKEKEKYNARKISKNLRDHKLMTAFAPYDNPIVAVTLILENGDPNLNAGSIVRKIIDHVILKGNSTKTF